MKIEKGEGVCLLTLILYAGAFFVREIIFSNFVKKCQKLQKSLTFWVKNLKTDLNAPWLYPKQMSTKVNLHLSGQSTLELSIDTFVLN